MKNRKYNLLPYETIVKAAAGEPEAVNTVIQTYTGYIKYLSYFQGSINDDIQDRLKAQLIKAVLQFIKFIRNINRSDIFCWANVKLLRKLGTSLLITFATTLTSTYMHTWQLSQVLKIPGYSYNWLNPFSHSSLLLGVLAFVIAEVFAIGLKMKEEQDLTI